MTAERIPERNEIPVEFTWDLTDIFKTDEARLLTIPSAPSSLSSAAQRSPIR